MRMRLGGHLQLTKVYQECEDLLPFGRNMSLQNGQKIDC